VPHTFQRAAKIMGARVNAQTYPNYNTAVADVDKYDLGTCATVEVVAATDIDNRGALKSLALTLSSTAANLLFAAGDSIWGSQTLGTSETTASSMLAVTLEFEEYGRPNQ
jgi:hypothetical protein